MNGIMSMDKDGSTKNSRGMGMGKEKDQAVSDYESRRRHNENIFGQRSSRPKNEVNKEESSVEAFVTSADIRRKNDNGSKSEEGTPQSKNKVNNKESSVEAFVSSADIRRKKENENTNSEVKKKQASVEAFVSSAEVRRKNDNGSKSEEEEEDTGKRVAAYGSLVSHGSLRASASINPAPTRDRSIATPAPTTLPAAEQQTQTTQQVEPTSQPTLEQDVFTGQSDDLTLEPVADDSTWEPDAAQERCALTSEGMYGDTDVGTVYNDITYLYQVTVVPRTDPNRVLLEVLPDIDRGVPEGLLPSLFPQCTGRRKLWSQSGQVDSISSQKKDEILLEGLPCIKPDPSDCFVVAGFMSFTGTDFYSRSDLDDMIQSEVKELMEGDFVERSNPLIVDVEYLAPDFQRIPFQTNSPAQTDPPAPTEVSTSTPTISTLTPTLLPTANNDTTEQTSVPTFERTALPTASASPTGSSGFGSSAPSSEDATPSPSPDDDDDDTPPDNARSASDDGDMNWLIFVLVGAGIVVLCLLVRLRGGNRSNRQQLSPNENSKDDGATMEEDDYVPPNEMPPIGTTMNVGESPSIVNDAAGDVPDFYEQDDEEEGDQDEGDEDGDLDGEEDDEDPEAGSEEDGDGSFADDADGDFDEDDADGDFDDERGFEEDEDGDFDDEGDFDNDEGFEDEDEEGFSNNEDLIGIDEAEEDERDQGFSSNHDFNVGGGAGRGFPSVEDLSGNGENTERDGSFAENRI